jgi:hypothetical protein
VVRFLFSSSSSSSLFSLFSCSGRSVARQKLLATSLRLDNRAPLGAGNSCAPDLFLAKSSSDGLNHKLQFDPMKQRTRACIAGSAPLLLQPVASHK